MEAKHKVSQLLGKLRNLAQDVSGRKLLSISTNPDVFLAPTQTAVFEFTRPDYTVIFFTHFEEKPDLEMSFAAQSSFAESLNSLPSIWQKLEDRKISQKWFSSHDSMHNLIEDAMRRLFGSLAEEICRPEKASFKISLSEDVAILEIRSTLGDVDAENLLAELIARAKAGGPKLPEPFQSARNRKAHAGNIFPLTTIGETKMPTLVEKVRKQWRGEEIEDEQSVVDNSLGTDTAGTFRRRNGCRGHFA